LNNLIKVQYFWLDGQVALNKKTIITPMKDSTKRFSDRVDDYKKYRPSYPQHVIKLLSHRIDLSNASVIADIGSGTGISSQLFIDNGNTVYAVEPNNEMRNAAELYFSNHPKFISISGTAENTNLESGSIDFIFAGQAFHWFNKSLAKIEFERILKKEGHIVLVWNVRDDTDDFQKEYEAILKQLPEFNDSSHKNISDQDIHDFFSPKEMQKESAENFQTFNLEGLKGRLKSSSYIPKSGPVFEKLMVQAESLFYKFERNGTIDFLYKTDIYWC
jgi:ubiquinone/menaquinone biosynthesis C-methylase UbiE